MNKNKLLIGLLFCFLIVPTGCDKDESEDKPKPEPKKPSAENFTFSELKRAYADGKTITTAQLLAQIAGAKTKGYLF